MIGSGSSPAAGWGCAAGRSSRRAWRATAATSGNAAYLRQRTDDPAAILCTLTVDDPTSSSGVKRYMLAREPVLTPDGKRIVDRKGRGSYVTSAGSGPSVGKHLLMTYLPPE